MSDFRRRLSRTKRVYPYVNNLSFRRLPLRQYILDETLSPLFPETEDPLLFVEVSLLYMVQVVLGRTSCTKRPEVSGSVSW